MNAFEKFQNAVPQDVEIILLGEYGSTAYGLALDASDHDYVGVGIEPKNMVLGMDFVGSRHWDNTVIKDNGQNSRSEAGSIEGTVHALRKFFKLSRDGNTAILSTLYLPRYEHVSDLGAHLLKNRDLFLSRRALFRFGAHLTHERDRMRGTMTEKVLRPELVKLHGYDTKAAYQALKLAYHGLHYARNAELVIPFPKAESEFILAVRRGEVPFEEVVQFLDETIETLNYEFENSTVLPEFANNEALDELLIEMYEMNFYGSSRD